MFGIQGLYHQLLSTQTAAVTSLGEALFSAVQSFSAGQPQSDDMTVMVLEYKPQFQFLIDSPAYACEVEHLSVNACNNAMQDILQTLQAYLAKLGIAHYNLCSVQLVIEEAFVNAINHGSLVLDTVDFYFTAFDQHIMVEMIDSGIAYNPFKESPVPELGLPIEDTDVGGLGVHLIRSMSKQYRYKRSNNKNHLCLLIKCDTDD
jgi:anti-sigma regulatory factor (Ser/Thr protein kinase)